MPKTIQTNLKVDAFFGKAKRWQQTHKETLWGMLTTAAWNQRWDRDNRPMVLERLERHRDKLVVLRYGELLQLNQNPR